METRVTNVNVEREQTIKKMKTLNEKGKNLSVPHPMRFLARCTGPRAIDGLQHTGIQQ